MRFHTLQAMVLGLSLGLVAGIGGYTFTYAKGYSYLTDQPEACANCHIMQEQYSGWLKSSHRAVAVCNDCHTPSGVSKYVTKAANGFRHSFAFTTGLFHEPIQITPGNRDITEHACRKCHEDIVQAIEGPNHESGTLECLRCHDSVGHPE
jgi:cytochrome c nitrite reductase small subunit